ncbi:MAG: LytTR family DNA-binding domain-containing protein [Clostridiales bacterium]|nr:LytTR family DNA-binding domain-containing protein [Clostridiales bacterium]
MPRIAIVEDDPVCARQLQDYVERYGRESETDLQTTLFPDGLDVVENYRPVWDVILMDIEMPNLDGMSAAQRIRAQDPAVVLIFITNMARFAIKGYEVDAMDFVLKPVKYPQFALKLKKALNIAGRRSHRYLMVRDGDATRRVATDTIFYIEVISHQLHIHTAEKTFVIRGSLQDMEEQLAGLPFVRCSHSYLVNLANVSGVKRDSLLVGGQEIPVSRSKRKEVLQLLSDYLGGGFQ